MNKQIIEKFALTATLIQVGESYKNNIKVYQFKPKIFFTVANLDGTRNEKGRVLILIENGTEQKNWLHFTAPVALLKIIKLDRFYKYFESKLIKFISDKVAEKIDNEFIETFFKGKI